MQTTTDKIIKEVLPRVCALAGKEVTKALVLNWVEGLCGLSVEELSQGMKRASAEHQDTWMMLPAKFREYCTTAQGESVEDEASQAWEEMIKLYTCTRSAYFKNHITAEIMRRIGNQMQFWEVKDLPFKKQDFIKDYKVLKTRGELYDPIVLKDGDNNPRLIGDFAEVERSQAKLNIKKCLMLEDNTKSTIEQLTNNKTNISGILNNLK